MRVLAIDTALGACQAAVLDGGRVLATRSETMARGHQERLAPLVAEAMGAASAPFSSVDRIAVTVGPGSFTGLRVGLAFAKGLGMALDRPVLGVGTLAALAASVAAAGAGAAVIDAGRDRVYLQAFEDGSPLGAPQTLAIEEAATQLVAAAPRRLVGPGASLLAGIVGAEAVALDAPDPAAVARLAASLAPAAAPPRPLYLRAPDARTLAERRAAASA